MSDQKAPSRRTHLHERGAHGAGPPTGVGGGLASWRTRALGAYQDCIVVERARKARRSVAAPSAPRASREDGPTEGRVLWVGSGTFLPDGSVRRVAVSVGDRVLFGSDGGMDLWLDDPDRVLLREDEILAVLAP